MKKVFIFMSVFMLISAAFLSAEKVEITENSGKQLFEITNSNENSIELQFSLSGYDTEIVTQNGKEYQKISCQDEGSFTEFGKPDLPRITRLIALPNRGFASIEICNIEYEHRIGVEIYPFQIELDKTNHNTTQFNIDSEFYQKGEMFPPKIAEIGSPAILRDIRVANLTINPFQYNPQTKELHIIKNAEIKITYDEKIGENEKTNHRKISRFFEPLYESNILNYESGRDIEYQEPTYLFIYSDNSSVESDLQYLIDWKHQKGFNVIAANTSETGTTSYSIKNYIQNLYDTSENPPEFICLVGDASGSYSVPTSSYDGGEGDQYYALLEGGDILADAYVGRISFGSITEFETILSKIFNYEREPYLGNTDWYNKVSLVGDPSSSGQSCIMASKNIKEIINANTTGFSFDEIYSSPWVSQISSSLNNGVMYYNYRGWYDVSGWGSGDIYNLNNGFMLPVAVVLTCGTGDFANYTSLSEVFLRAGTVSVPKGAIASIATATITTHTCFNNCVSIGTAAGLFQDKIYNMGGALTRGKLSLYLNYPNNPNDWVNRFSYWNNLMGDPGMEIWTGVPKEMNITYDSQISVGTNLLEVTVETTGSQPIESAWVTALMGDDEIFSTGYTDEDGKIFLTIDAATSGTVNLTVTKHNFVPHLGSFEISQFDKFVNVYNFEIDDDNSEESSGNGNGIINPNENIELNVSLKNFGSLTANNVSATISTENEFVTISDATENFGDISSGDNTFSDDDFNLEIAENSLGGTEIILDVLISDNSDNQWNDKIFLVVEGPNIYANDYSIFDDNNGIWDPGESVELAVNLKNIGSVSANNLDGILRCEDESITLIDSLGTFGNISAGGESSNSGDLFECEANSQIIPGTQISFSILLTNADGYSNEIYFVIEIGEPSINDPLGPDEYGYYAYDDGDIEYDLAPTYSWIEIDPDYGGAGTNLSLYDNGDTGDIEIIDIPFTIFFYGRRYSEITVCSNGWIAPGESEQSSFMNWNIPSSLGPSPIIAPFWDDLSIGSGDVFYYFDEIAHYIVVEWSRVQNDYDNSEETFQVIIYDQDFYPTLTGDAEILFQYKTVNNVDQGNYYSSYVDHGEFATVGLENHSSTTGLEYTFSNSYPTAAKHLENNMAIFFTTNGANIVEPPVAEISQDNFQFTVLENDNDSQTLEISNSGEANLTYSISKYYQDTKDSGGPDDYGYQWIDSNEQNGPEYNWIDISDVGTQVSFANNDTGTDLIPIGFTFNFYGEDYTQFRINPNGWIGFGNDNSQYNNFSIPSSSAPKPALLTFWDDLNPENENPNGAPGGNVYYHSNAERLVVWFDDVVEWSNWNPDGIYNFQMILYPNGEILFQYNSMNGTTNSATIGIQNAGGSDGLQVAYNSNYVENNLAIRFKQILNWTNVSPQSGFITSGNTEIITISVASDELDLGDYLCNLILSTNDPNLSEVTISVNLSVVSDAVDYGDVDENGEIQAFDAALTLQYSAGLIEFEEWQILAGDVDGNEIVQAYDAALILQYSAGLIDEFPVEGK